MFCLFTHEWGWPRKRGDRDLQVCVRCGAERQSKVQFDGPHYRKTQDGFSGVARPGPWLVPQVKEIEALPRVA